jgi:hypothetical protein
MTPKSQEARPRKAPGRLKQAARTKTEEGSVGSDLVPILWKHSTQEKVG